MNTKKLIAAGLVAASMSGCVSSHIDTWDKPGEDSNIASIEKQHCDALADDAVAPWWSVGIIPSHNQRVGMENMCMRLKGYSSVYE